ncbi:ImmA/IrrE family metallo-endopeptidase [Enterococcus cecorum]|uniref:ImmA/IrrE family metallo-endopeptidase n=1 Tax=Enterococcus cecorum TaxID=44008 RepID=UPI0032651E82
MNKALIDELIENLVEECGTRDPFKIARQKNIIVLEEPLKEIKGYYNKIKRIQMIHINDDLNYFERMFVCAHELGHALLHPNDQTNKLSTYSTVSTLKKESEANYFATNLIVDGTVAWEIENPTNEQIINFYGIPREMERFINR